MYARVSKGTYGGDVSGWEERRNWGKRSDHMSYIEKGALNMRRTTEDAPAKTGAKFTQFRGVEVIVAYLPIPPTVTHHFCQAD